MAVMATPVFVQAPKNSVTAYTTGSSTVTVITGGTNGSKVAALVAASNSTSAHIFTVAISTGGTAATLTAVSIPAASGTDGSTPSVDMLNSTILPGLPVDNDGQRYLFLQSTSHILTVLASATINTGKQVSFNTVYGDF